MSVADVVVAVDALAGDRDEEPTDGRPPRVEVRLTPHDEAGVAMDPAAGDGRDLAESELEHGFSVEIRRARAPQPQVSKAGTSGGSAGTVRTGTVKP